MTITAIGPQFPNFLAECMFRDGVRLVRGTGAPGWDHTQHGCEGSDFYLMGVRAAEAS